MKCLAIDDEPLALKLLEDNIKNLSYLHLVASCVNVFDAMRCFQKTKLTSFLLIYKCRA